MPLLSVRLLIPIALVVLAWAGIHAIGAHNLAVTPAVWPASSLAPTPTPRSAMLPSERATPAPSAGNDTGIPVLPGALQQLNSSTRDTAVGLYTLIQELERALGSRLEHLAQQLELGR